MQLGVFLATYTLWAVLDNFSFTMFNSALIYYCVVCMSAETSPSTLAYTRKWYIWHVKHMLLYIYKAATYFVLLLFMYSPL